MYIDDITVFNAYTSNSNLVYKATHLSNVDLNLDKSVLLGRYGDSSGDRAILHVHDLTDYVEAKSFTGTGFTFATGENFSFFIRGTWSGASTIQDSAYDEGFYNYMNSTYETYAVSNVARYSVIPHLEVTAR